VPYVTSLAKLWPGWQLDPTNHLVLLVITLVLLALQTSLNIIGAKVMGRVAQFGVYVEILGTFGVAVVLGIHGFHHGLGFLTSTLGAEHASANALGLNFGGSWLGAALIAVLAPVYIFYGFESAGDISEETRNAGRQVPRAMRLSLLSGGIASFVLTAALLLAMPAGAASANLTVQNVSDLGAVHFTAASNVTLTDTAAHIQAASDFTTFATHGVFTYDREDRLYKLFWHDSLGYYPPSPASGGWSGKALILVRGSLRGNARHVYEVLDDNSYSMKIQFSPDAEGWADVLTGVYRRIH